MLLSAELKTTILDRGIPGVSSTELLLIFGMMLAISMIPYFFLYLSLRPKRGTSEPTPNLVEKLIGWLHPHRHPELLHH
jgi:hypothetical protein